jgi:UDP-glucuronate 4-epimerase
MNKTILVTGSAGFIGSHLVESLVQQGHSVIGVDNFNDFYDQEIKYANLAAHFTPNEIQALLKDFKSPYRFIFSDYTPYSDMAWSDSSPVSISKNNYTLYSVDLCDYTSMHKIFAKHNISHIVHIAALAGVRPSTERPIIYQKNNGESTINLLELAQKFAIKKFVFASSSSVYGSRSKVPFAESEDISKPISPYAATKVAGEAMLHAFHNLYKISSVALRFFTVYGPRQRPDLAITKFTKLISQGQTIEVYGDGLARRDFTYIDDILDGILKAIDLDCAYEIFNLGESQTTDVNTLIRLLEQRLEKEALVRYLDPVPGDVPVTFANIAKSEAILGYQPQTKLEAGLDKFVTWYRANYKQTV